MTFSECKPGDLFVSPGNLKGMLVVAITRDAYYRLDFTYLTCWTTCDDHHMIKHESYDEYVTLAPDWHIFRDGRIFA
jgi:hypothetical protein